MKFVRYEKLEDFMNENFELLLEKEWLNCLMVGNCTEGNENNEDWFLAKVIENEKTELIMFYRKPWKFLMYSPTDNTSDELYKFAAEETHKYESNLIGINAEKEIANKFAKYYCEVSKKQYKLVTPMKILVLEKIAPIQKVLSNEVVFREAREEDRNQLTKYIQKFYMEAVNEEVSDEKAQEKFGSNLERGYYVLEKKGKIVSQAVIGRRLIKGKCISGVYTIKEERGNGYAYNLVYEITKKCLDEGAEYCVLYTDAENPISNHVYEKIGYEKRVECEDIEFFDKI